MTVGGESGDDSWENDQGLVRQFSSALVYDVEAVFVSSIL